MPLSVTAICRARFDKPCKCGWLYQAIGEKVAKSGNLQQRTVVSERKCLLITELFQRMRGWI